MSLKISIIDLLRAETERLFTMDLTALRVEDQAPPSVPSARAIDLRTNPDVHGPASRRSTAKASPEAGGGAAQADFSRAQVRID